MLRGHVGADPGTELGVQLTDANRADLLQQLVMAMSSTQCLELTGFLLDRRSRSDSDGSGARWGPGLMIRRRCLDALESRLSECLSVPLLFCIGSTIGEISDSSNNHALDENDYLK